MKYHESKRRGFMTRMDVGPQAFIVSSRAKADAQRNWPDLQIVFVQQPVIGKGQPQTISLQIIVNRMKSSGEIRFNTTAYRTGDRDDLKLALIDFRLFSEPSDAEVLIEGVQELFSIVRMFSIDDVLSVQVFNSVCRLWKIQRRSSE